MAVEDVPCAHARPPPFVADSEPMSVGDLAEALGESPISVIKFLMTDLGIMAAVSQSLDVPTCEAVTEGFGKVVAGDDDDLDDDEE